jgi:hypothetical protein
MENFTNNNEEIDCFYINSSGILKSCDIKENNPKGSFTDIDNLDLQNAKNGCTIYVCADSINTFVDKIDSINCNFKLVSGYGDVTISNEFIEKLKDLMNSPKLIKWYSQNCIATHPKLVKIPIGLDYHSDQDQINGYLSPMKHEEKILQIVNNCIPFYKRKAKAYANYHFRLEYQNNDRKDAYQNINKDLVYYIPNRTERFETYKEQTNYAFVISPHGNGLDCHRTWEALILGCIPIVKKSELDDLYSELPVLIVNEWSDLTQELLNNTINEFKNKKFNYDKLTLKYWINKINHSSIL